MYIHLNFFRDVRNFFRHLCELVLRHQMRVSNYFVTLFTVQLVFTFNNQFFCHQACYSLLPARPGGQAERVVGLYKYKVVGPTLCPSYFISTPMYSLGNTVVRCRLSIGNFTLI